MRGLSPVESAGGIRTLRDALPATDAAVIILHDDSIGPFERRAYRAGPDAWRVVTVHARTRHVVLARSGIVGYLVDLDPLLHRRHVMHLVAGLRAVATAVALGQVKDHHPFLVGRRLGPPGQRPRKHILGCELPDAAPGDYCGGATCEEAEQSASCQCHNASLSSPPRYFVTTSFIFMSSWPSPHLTVHSMVYSPGVEGATTVYSFTPSLTGRSHPWSFRALIVRL